MILTEAALLWSAAVIAVVTVGVGAVTMGASVWYRRRDRRRERGRKRVQSALFERLFSDDPGWEAWVGTLSDGERRRVRERLDEYLRQLRGTEHARLRDLASALGIPAEARRNLDSKRDRYRALTWLALLEEPVDPGRLEATCGDDPQLRAGAARVIYASGHPDAAVAGTELLLGNRDRALTVFGMDTLYRLNDGGETPLLERMADGVEEWNARLLVQALLVLRYCDIADPGDRLGWLPAVLERDSPRVRAAAVGAIERHGWRDRLRDEIDIEAVLGDPEAAVREDGYLLLASWGDERSATWLRWAHRSAPRGDELALTRATLLHPKTDLSELPADFEPFAEWVRADKDIGRRRQVWGVSAAWS